jgi:peptidoglycan biosynthesis protein MviN/MurJ (putative lipid II flippase)
MENRNVSVVPYVALFSTVYAGLLLMLNAIVYGLNVDIGSSASVAMLLGAAYSTIAKFVSEHKRTPKKSERQKLIWGSILASFIVSLIVVATVLMLVANPAMWEELDQLFQQISVGVWLGILVLATLLQYIVLSLVYGWGAKHIARRLPATGNPGLR